MASAYGQSYYGQGVYGQATTWPLAGHTAPSVTLAGSLSQAGKVSLKGDLRPSVNYPSAVLINLAHNVGGGMQPEVIYSASLTETTKYAGDLAPNVVLAANAYVGPLWIPIPPCPAVEWEEVELCDG